MQLPRPLVNQLLAQAQSQPEQEICGLIGGDGRHPPHCYPVANVAAEPSHRYRLDPAQQIDAMRQMRERGERLLAIYHSHPHGPARPSATDLREAQYPEAVYLIISLGTTGVLEMRGFRLRDGSVEEVELELTD